MNSPSLFKTCRAALGLALMAGLASCTSPVERRITANPELYNKLSGNEKSLVSQGRIREGFTKEAVFLAMGRPDQVAAGSQKGAKLEKWTYVGTQPVYSDSYGFGWGGGYGRFGGGYRRGGFGYGYGYGGAWDPFWGGYGPTVTYVPYKAASVTFRSGRVTEYMRGPQ